MSHHNRLFFICFSSYLDISLESLSRYVYIRWPETVSSFLLCYLFLSEKWLTKTLWICRCTSFYVYLSLECSKCFLLSCYVVSWFTFWYSEDLLSCPFLDLLEPYFYWKIYVLISVLVFFLLTIRSESILIFENKTLSVTVLLLFCSASNTHLQTFSV